MNYLSLFSGIEAASVAWQSLGFDPVAFSEIDPFCCALLKHYYPHVPNLGDITKIKWEKLHEAIDIIVGGSPCQSFSIAGGREGLDGESRLMYEYIRAVQEVLPKWLLWENVPGVFSTDKGRAFGILLDSLEKCGYVLAWRVLDAQFFRVAQRRRRVFLVGHLGERIGVPTAVLFDSQSVSGNTTSSREKRAELASRAQKSSAVSSIMPFDTTQITSATNRSMPNYGRECHTLSAKGQPPVIAIANDSASAAIDRDVCGTLIGYGSPAMVLKVRQGKSGGGKGALVNNNCSFTLATHQDQTLFTGNRVRRLTPLECERLQGFPDGYTDIVYRGKPAADTPRYKALGSSMAVSVMRYLGERIYEVDKLIREDDSRNELC